MTRRRRRSGTDRSRGQALAELALVLPIFLLVVFALFDVGRVVFINNSLSEATRDGARWGSVQGRSFDATSRTGIATETAGRMSAVPDPTITVSCERDGSAVAQCHTNDVLVVRADSSVELVTPVLGAIIGPLNLAAEARVAVHQ